MNPHRRLLESESPQIRALLEAGLRDNPRAQALPKAAIALGLTAPAWPLGAASAAVEGAANTGLACAGEAVATAGAATTAAAAGSAALLGGNAGIAASTVPATSSALAGAAAKWLLVGVVSGSVVTGSWSVLTHSASSPVHPSSSSRAGNSTYSPGALRVTPGPLRRLAEPAPSPEPGDSPTPAPAQSVTPRTSTKDSAPVVPPGDPEFRGAGPAIALRSASEPAAVPHDTAGALARETGLIDATRRALTNQDWSHAQALLDKYESTRRIGVLDREALLLRIDFYSRRGEKARAQELARRFIATYPNDAHVARLNLVLNDPSGSEPSPHPSSK